MNEKTFVEHDSRAKAKAVAEFITPPKLRKFVADKINEHCDKKENLTLLDCSIGSGQLLFELSNKIEKTLRVPYKVEVPVTKYKVVEAPTRMSFFKQIAPLIVLFFCVLFVLLVIKK